MSDRPGKPTPQDAIEAALRGMARVYGQQAADSARQKVLRQQQARRTTEARQAEAAAISERRVARGDGAELQADARPRATSSTAAAPQPSALGDQLKPALKSRARSRSGSRSSRSKAKQAQRHMGKLGSLYERRHTRHQKREAEQAEAMAEKALRDHGIRHHYRALPKVAFFGAYMAGLDRNGRMAVEALLSCNMPRARVQQVLKAAFEPGGYTPRRDVCRGRRADQSRYAFDGRSLGVRRLRKRDATVDRPGWQDGQRDTSHPGAIRVIQCAVFLWLSKSRTARPGFSYRVRGFGRGVFASICRCGKDAITGHTDGLPGALRALHQAGFIQYGQPPSGRVASLDRGPSGHAYNVYWMRSTPEELQLQAYHERIAELGRMPVLQRLLQDPELIALRLQGPPGTAPPDRLGKPFLESEIPF